MSTERHDKRRREENKRDRGGGVQSEADLNTNTSSDVAAVSTAAHNSQHSSIHFINGCFARSSWNKVAPHGDTGLNNSLFACVGGTKGER